jgi:hypothetical protein
MQGKGWVHTFRMWRFTILLPVLAVLTIASAPPVLAASPQAPSAVTLPTCNQSVCETVLGVGDTVYGVNGVALPPGSVCGLFTMTATSLTGAVLDKLNSPVICSSQPTYSFLVLRIFPTGTTIAMQFTGVPGKPTVVLPLSCLPPFCLGTSST